MPTLRGVDHAAITSAVREARAVLSVKGSPDAPAAEAGDSAGQRLLSVMRHKGREAEAEALSNLSPGALDAVAMGATPRLPQDLRD